MTDKGNALEDLRQYEIALELLLALMRVQTVAPGAISPEDLPKVLSEAADGRKQQGDDGAARLLFEWAQTLAQQMGRGSK
ncbi:hypothetical protein ACFSYD_19135 [Paracoccus aerius]